MVQLAFPVSCQSYGLPPTQPNPQQPIKENDWWMFSCQMVIFSGTKGKHARINDSCSGDHVPCTVHVDCTLGKKQYHLSVAG